MELVRGVSGTGDRPTHGTSRVHASIPEVQERVVRFHYDPKVHRVWLDVLDKQSGKVVQEIPPEAVRKMLELLLERRGLIVDQQG